MTQLANSPEVGAAEVPNGPCTPQKQEMLATFYRQCWKEMTWRRNAGYRTIILGMAYCGILLAVVAFNHQMGPGIRWCLAGIVAVATVFGAAYLASNYYKYMSAAEKTVKIEEYVGAYESDYLGGLGPLMDGARRNRPKVPLHRDPVCFWSVAAFAVGGLLTAVAILLA